MILLKVEGIMDTLNWIKTKREIVIYYITTTLLTWIIWFPALLIQNFDVYMTLPYDLFITVGTFVPTVVGFIFVYIFGGKTELKSVFKSLINIHFKARWLFFILLVLPGVSVVSCLVLWLSGNNLPQMQFATWFIPIAFVYILIFMGPLGEEVGWRGFALKRMLRSSSPIKAAILIGIIWSIWHTPLFFINRTTQNTLSLYGIVPALLGYFLYTIMISILITLLYIKTNGSIFCSIMIHTIGNLSLGLVPIIFTKNGAMIMLFVLCIVTVVIVYIHKQLMFRKA